MKGMSGAAAVERDRAEKSLALLCNEQTRAMLAQNAANLGRLAAAISHEINTPLGALRSAVDTLSRVAERSGGGAEADARLAALQTDLLKTIRDSTFRLSEVVQRMQRFTNLNRAEVQRTCINGLIADVIGLLDADVRERIRIELDQQPGLPYVIGHPQQLSAVFSILVNHAIDSIDGAGQIRILTRYTPGLVHVEVHDDGRGIPASILPGILDPVFETHNGRVASTNWNLFSSRHIIESHGGAIEVASTEGQGTSVSITLPAEPAAHG